MIYLFACVTRESRPILFAYYTQFKTLEAVTWYEHKIFSAYRVNDVKNCFIVDKTGIEHVLMFEYWESLFVTPAYNYIWNDKKVFAILQEQYKGYEWPIDINPQ